MEIKQKKIVEDPIPELVELNNSIKNCIKPKSECIVDITNNWPELEVSEDVKKLLNDLFIRFNTSPKLYNKIDYLKLLQLVYGSLIHLYKNNPEDLIVTNWLNPLSDVQVPSEKLTKETIDSLDNEITQVSSDLQTEIGNRQSEISRVEGLISAEESARILADLNLQNTKLDNLTAGANIQINGTTISATDTIYDDTVLSGRVTTIENKIPAEASSSNQLADKEFVHDLIATNASNFRGDWANWTSVPTDPLYYPEDYTGNKKPNNNDYLIIQNATDYDPSNTGIWRFVYKGDWDTLGKSGWEPQYRVELAFTPELLNAINSGITSLKVSNYDNYRQEIDDLFPLIAAGL